MMYPNILILCSEDVFTTNSSGSFTIRSLFGAIPKDHIYQLLCLDETNKAGRIDEHHFVLGSRNIVFGSFLRRRKKHQRTAIIPVQEVARNKAGNHSIKSFLKAKAIDMYKSMPFLLSKDLLAYVKEINADIIYTATSMPRVLKLLGTLSNKLQVPAIPHFFDDWPNVSFCNSPILKHFFNSALIRTIHRAPYCLCISQLMCDEYTKRYNYDRFIPLMHSVKQEDIHLGGGSSTTLHLLYAGSLYLGRYETLIKLCEIVKKNGINNISIEVYTKREAWEELKNCFESYGFVNYGGFISQEELMSKIRMSDGLLFFESFFDDILNYTRLSLSTKVPEYLSSGRRIFAVGNAAQGSIKYLADNNAAYVATEETAIESVFLDFVMGKNEEQILKNAFELFSRNHDIDVQQAKFYNLIKESILHEKVINNNPCV